MSAAKDRERARLIRAELCRMGREGWHRYTFADWQPLEAELRALDDKLRAKREAARPAPLREYVARFRPIC